LRIQESVIESGVVIDRMNLNAGFSAVTGEQGLIDTNESDSSG
jgi:hypothetical protein